MKIPNFDDKDLAIVGLVVLGVTGFVIGWAMSTTTTEMFAFGTAMGLGIAGLATGKKKEEPSVIPPAADPVKDSLPE